MKYDYDKTAPLALNPILLIRADNASASDMRMRGKDYIVDRNAVPVPEADKTPEKIALEQNPNLMFEHWDEYWRKVHGPRVVYQEGDDDQMLSGVCTYYQIHRLPAAPCSAFPPPYDPILDENGELYPATEIHVPHYHRPMYDGLVYWGAPTIEDLIPVGYSPRALNKVNFEGNVFNRNAVSGLSSEYIIIPLEKSALPPLCAVKIHYRKSGSRKDFRDHLLKEHGQRIAELAETKNYVRRFAYIFCENKDVTESFATEEGMRVDAISVMYFDNMADCENYFSSAGYRGIQKAEETFLDMNRSEWWTGIIYPFFYPKDEQVTDINKRIN